MRYSFNVSRSMTLVTHLQLCPTLTLGHLVNAQQRAHLVWAFNLQTSTTHTWQKQQRKRETEQKYIYYNSIWHRHSILFLLLVIHLCISITVFGGTCARPSVLHFTGKVKELPGRFWGYSISILYAAWRCQSFLSPISVVFSTGPPTSFVALKFGQVLPKNTETPTLSADHSLLPPQLSHALPLTGLAFLS